MDLFKQFATDDNLEINGAWHKGPGDTEFLIARSNNRKYQRLLAKRVEENQELLEAKNDEADVRSEEVMAELFAETILLGWRGTVTFKGQPVTYSKETAKQMLMMKEFRKWVSRKAEDLDAYRAKLEQAQGNA